MLFHPAPDIKKRIDFLVAQLKFDKFLSSNLYCFRSTGSSGRATARIWSLPAIWRQALNVGPGYCIEVISERFDKLNSLEQEKVLIHELLHIPQKFTGGLVPHRTKSRRRFANYHHAVDQLFNSLISKSYENLSR